MAIEAGTLDSPEAQSAREDARTWLDANWDPQLTLGEWWRLVADSGWGFPAWPEDWFGRGLDPQLARVVAEAWNATDAVRPNHGIGTMMAAPAILTHGTEEQKKRFVAPIVYGEEEWCQLFSEPGAGSDLAGLQTRAERDGDVWRISGQKVWTSAGQYAKWGFLIARTNPDLPKHKGITYFLIDMRQPGVEVRPLREMAGSDTFSEVFFDGATVPDENVVGEIDGGWAVAMTTLSHERQGMGAGAFDESGGGQVYGEAPLAKVCAEIVGTTHEFPGRRMCYGHGALAMLREVAEATEKTDDALSRQQIANVYSLLEVARYTRLRNQAQKALGRNPGPAASVGKLASARLARTLRETATGLLGAGSMLGGEDAPLDGIVNQITLFSPSTSIAGGTDEVQRNIVGERVLGLPREPDPSKGAAFKDLKVGTQT